MISKTDKNNTVLYCRPGKVLLVLAWTVICFSCLDTAAVRQIAVSTNKTARNARTDALAAQAHFRGGMEQVQRGNYSAAIRSFSSAVKLDPSMAEAYLNLGACFERQGDFKRGKPFYLKAISLEPANARLHYLYGTALIRNGFFADGLTRMERAVYLEPKNMDYLFNLGLGFSTATQFHHAASCFEEVASVVSNESIVWHYLGMTRFMLGQTNQAVAAWEHVEIDSPVAAETYYHLAAIEMSQGRVDSAIARTKLALKLNPGLANARELLAMLHRRKGNYREASNILEDMNLASPSARLEDILASLYREWAEQTYTQQQYRVALDRFRQAGRFRPGSAEIQIGIARSALAIGELDKAKSALNRARRYASTDAEENAVKHLADQLENAQKSTPD
jgi:tetratricopeptide (TPR) repeat protein